MQGSDWRRYFFYRKESLHTTWTLRIFVLLLVVLLVWATKGPWTAAIAKSLICEESISKSDGLLVENFDPDYLVFEKAAALERAGVAPKIFVPVATPSDPRTPSTLIQEVTEMLASRAHIQKFEAIPIDEIEPISLNAANQIRDSLKTHQVNSVVVVTPGFRSRRSFLIYNTVLPPAGIRVGCAPVIGSRSPRTWFDTWHGVQEVGEQFLKLLYYRFYVLW